MGYPADTQRVTPPKDPSEFEDAVIMAVESILKDGSNKFTVNTILLYNLWHKNRSVSARISAILKNHGYISQQRCGNCAQWSAAVQEVSA